MAIVIQAANIHRGGGKALLCGLLDSLAGEETTVFVDTRFNYECERSDLKIVWVKPSLYSRLRVELSIEKSLQPDDILICFGNLPPLIANHPKTVLFLQNRYLVGKRRLILFKFPNNLRITLERMWFKHRLSNVSDVIVQTRTVADALFRYTGRSAIICPFLPLDESPKANQHVPVYDFVYVASGEPHKNHKNLIEAWRILSLDSINPSLVLTLEEGSDGQLWEELLEVIEKFGLSITNRSNQANVDELYQSSRALIYPSTFESLGLPLLEAQNHKLPILASELDFVRDSVSPDESFDPASPISIARAVRRFLKCEETPPAISSPREFVEVVRDIYTQ